MISTSNDGGEIRRNGVDDGYGATDIAEKTRHSDGLGNYIADLEGTKEKDARGDLGPTVANVEDRRNAQSTTT